MSDNVDPIPSFKVIALGGSMVGKSTLLYRYENGEPPKIGSTYTGGIVSKVIDVEGFKLKLNIWDPNGQKYLRKPFFRLLYRDVDAVLLMYDITDAKSFQVLNEWLEEIELNGVEISKLPCMLLANKCDLRDSAKVTQEEGQKYAKVNNMMYFETSAYTNDKVNLVEDVFLYLSRILKYSLPKETSTKDGSCY